MTPRTREPGEARRALEEGRTKAELLEALATLQARLAEVEAERDEARASRQDWHADWQVSTAWGKEEHTRAEAAEKRIQALEVIAGEAPNTPIGDALYVTAPEPSQ